MFHGNHVDHYQIRACFACAGSGRCDLCCAHCDFTSIVVLYTHMLRGYFHTPQ